MRKLKARGEGKLFAFKWFELPEWAQNAIEFKIKQKYGLDLSDQDVLAIFNCLVTRDLEIKMPYVKTEDEPGFDGIRPHVVYNKEKHCRQVVYTHDSWGPRKAYFIFVYRTDGYKMVSAENSNFTAEFEDEAAYYDYAEVEETCEELIRPVLLNYVCFGFSEHTPEALEAKNKFLERIKNYDWTKKGTVPFKKSDYMMYPRKWDSKDPFLRIPDWQLGELIEKYKLSAETDHDFINWIANGCRGAINGKPDTSLKPDNVDLVNTTFAFPELTRANVVDLYHGFPQNLMHRLQRGSIFTAGKNNTKYVVLKTDVCDGCPVIAYAKLGTKIDGDGFIQQKDILLGLRSQEIVDCWGALFDINRMHRRKKILKNVKIIKSETRGGEKT